MVSARTRLVARFAIPLCLLLGLLLAAAPAAVALSTYPQKGFLWLRYYSNGELWVSSTNCNNWELSAFDKIRTSTAGTTQFAGHWPQGLKLIQKRCDGVVRDSTDIKIIYVKFTDQHPQYTEAWGDNHSDRAPEEWCRMFGKRYPCGTHIARVHIDSNDWNDSGRSAAWREHLLSHETGHSVGMPHHCFDESGNPEDSIMNTPLGEGSACTSANWNDVIGYQAVDRARVVTIHTN